MRKLFTTLALLPFIMNACASAPTTAAEVPNYIGLNTSTRINDTNAVSINGKYKVPNQPLSVRPELTLSQTGYVGGAASLTLDVQVPVGTIYSGFGVSVEQLFPTSDTKTYGVVGVESVLNDRYTVSGQVKLPFTSVNGAYKPAFSVGLGYNL
jgi:hypothetical protein